MRGYLEIHNVHCVSNNHGDGESYSAECECDDGLQQGKGGGVILQIDDYCCNVLSVEFNLCNWMTANGTQSTFRRA